VILGVMSQARRWYYRIACGLLCVSCICVALMTAPPASFVFLGVALLAVAFQLWIERRIIAEFLLDRRALQFRTLATSRTQTREVRDIAAVVEWRGAGAFSGYQLVFRDGARAYLERSVANSGLLADQLRSLLRS
jgi:hypothetical protein